MAREVVDPRKDQSDRESKENRYDGESLGPVGYFKRRKNLSDNLNEQPTHDGVGNRDTVNSSSL